MGDDLDARIQAAYRFAVEKIVHGHTPEQVKEMLVSQGHPAAAIDLMMTMIAGKLAATRRRGGRYRVVGSVLVVGGATVALVASVGPWGWAVAAIGLVVYFQGWLLR